MFESNNHGSCDDLFAPGLSLRSASKEMTNSKTKSSGSSMAAPLVAGTAAIILSSYPTFTPQDVKQVILESATRGLLKGPHGFPRLPGHGTPNKVLFAPWARVFEEIRVDQLLPESQCRWVSSRTQGESVEGHPAGMQRLFLLQSHSLSDRLSDQQCSSWLLNS